MRLLAFLLGLSALAVVATVTAVNTSTVSSSRRRIQRSNLLKNRLTVLRPKQRARTALAYPIAFSVN